MQYVHVKNLEKYHPGYKDRTLQWAKVYFKMVQGDPQCEMLNEMDWGRLIKFILLELEAQSPIPIESSYLTRKGFDLKKRPVSLTLQVLHNFLDTVDSNVDMPTDTRHVDKSKNKIKNKIRYEDYVLLTDDEFKSLSEKLGEPLVREYITALNDYIGSKGKRYKSHYHTILNWHRMNPRQPKPKKDDML